MLGFSLDDTGCSILLDRFKLELEEGFDKAFDWYKTRTRVFDWISVEQLNAHKVIATGSFATVKPIEFNGELIALKTSKEEFADLDVKRMYELYLIRTLRHANLVKFIRFVEFLQTKSNNELSLMISIGMELCVCDLYKLWSEKLLSLDEKLTTHLHCLKALDYLHRRNIIHRDVKPQNILLSFDGSLKLADFGFSRFVNTRKMGMRIGTGTYMAPEVSEPNKDPKLESNYDQKADVFSMGVVFYEIWLEIRLRVARQMSLVSQRDEPPGPIGRNLLAKAPQDVARLIADMMSYSVDQRPRPSQLLDLDTFRDASRIKLNLNQLVARVKEAIG